jgi:hypothetical protein
MTPPGGCMRLAALAAALLVGASVAADVPPIEPSDPELLQFLGELAGEDALFVQYTTTREARRAAKDAGNSSGAAALEAAVGAVAWDTLDAPTQVLLAGQADRWATLPPERQWALADGAQRWLALDGIGRAQANERWQTWRSLTPGQRERVHKAWDRFRELTPQQQQAVRTAFLRYQELPQEQRDWLTERWQQMTPDERERAIQRRQGPGPQPGAMDKRPCPPCR